MEWIKNTWNSHQNTELIDKEESTTINNTKYFVMIFVLFLSNSKFIVFNLNRLIEMAVGHLTSDALKRGDQKQII